MKRLLIVLGTRPEVIKLAPVVAELKRERAFKVSVCATAQHQRLARQMFKAFRVKPDFDLGLMEKGQTPERLALRVLEALNPLLRRLRPDLLLVQGDTTSAMAAALSGYQHHVPVAHVEAGLRTHDPSDPHPEEKNRVIIDHLSALLFAPTPLAKRNLRRESIPSGRIFVTGNTVVDAFRLSGIRSAAAPENCRVLLTIHRRESFGRPLAGVFSALLRLVKLYPELELIFPVHPNPEVLGPARRRLRHQRIRIIAPLPYREFLRLAAGVRFIMTDSGGLQEEAACLGKPVLVLREKTERPELIASGGGWLTGLDPDEIVSAAARLITDSGLLTRMSRRGNLFGDGRASERIVSAVRHWFGLGRRPVDWKPAAKRV